MYNYFIKMFEASILLHPSSRGRGRYRSQHLPASPCRSWTWKVCAPPRTRLHPPQPTPASTRPSSSTPMGMLGHQALHQWVC